MDGLKAYQSYETACEQEITSDVGQNTRIANSCSSMALFLVAANVSWLNNKIINLYENDTAAMAEWLRRWT